MEYILPVVLLLILFAAMIYFDSEGQNRPSKPSKQKKKAKTFEKGIKLREEESGPELVYNGETGEVYVETELNVYERGLCQSGLFYCPEIDTIVEVALGNNNLIQFTDENGIGFISNSPAYKGAIEEWTYSNFGDNCVFLEISEGDMFESESING